MHGMSQSFGDRYGIVCQSNKLYQEENFLSIGAFRQILSHSFAHLCRKLPGSFLHAFSLILAHALIKSFLLRDGCLVVHATSCESSPTHVVAHVTSVGRLRNVLLLKAFARDLLLLGGAFLVRAPTHSILEAFATTSRPTGSVLLDACSTSGPWSNRQARASLTGVAALHVVRTLRNANPRAWLELLDGLPVADANGRLSLVLGLLVSAVGVLLLLLIHVRTRVKGSCRASVCRWTDSRSVYWLLHLVLLLIHISRCSNAHGSASFLLLLIVLTIPLS